MAVYRTRVMAVAAKIEAVSGTDSAPTLAANAVRTVGIPVLEYGYLEPGARDDVVFGGMGNVARAAPVGRFGRITIRLEARGNNTGYAEISAQYAEVDAFLRAAGFDGVNGVYSSLDDGFETLTLHLYSSNKLFKLVGVVVHAKLSATVNQRAFWDFECTGVLVENPTQTALGAITHNQTIPPLFANTGVTFAGLTYAGGLLVRSVELDYPVTMATRDAAGAPDGIVGYAITQRGARLTMEIEQLPLATFDPYARSRDAGSGGTATNGSLTIGGVALNRILVEWGQWALEAPTHGDNAGLALWTLTGELVAGSLAANSRESRISFT